MKTSKIGRKEGGMEGKKGKQWTPKEEGRQASQ